MSGVETSICISVLCVYILKATSPTRIVNRLGKRNWVRLNCTFVVRSSRPASCINDTRDIVTYNETVTVTDTGVFNVFIYIRRYWGYKCLKLRSNWKKWLAISLKFLIMNVIMNNSSLEIIKNLKIIVPYVISEKQFKDLHF